MENNVITLDDKLRTVAEFSGFKRLGNWGYSSEDILFEIDRETKWFINGMKFHTSYDWLMKAWHRWNGHEVLVWVSIGMAKHDMGFSEFENRTKKVGQCILHKPIGEAFDALYEAIVWYNSLNK